MWNLFGGFRVDARHRGSGWFAAAIMRHDREAACFPISPELSEAGSRGGIQQLCRIAIYCDVVSANFPLVLQIRRLQSACGDCSQSWAVAGSSVSLQSGYRRNGSIRMAW